MADIESAKKAFERFDIDGDGLITAAEFKSVMAELGDFNVTETVAAALIKRVDADGDTKISWEEFWAARQARAGARRPDAGARRTTIRRRGGIFGPALR
jgi:Ca2+-binding EF-hand superfamily protein